MSNNTERLFRWDNVKFLLIFCVVIGHICEKYTGQYEFCKGLFLLIYIFHMPAFLFVSGLFSKKTIKERKYKTIVSYLMLYFFIKLVRNGVHFVIYGSGSFSLLSESGVAWYAGLLFAYCLLTIFFDKIQWKYVLVFITIVGCFSGYDTEIGDWLILSRCFTYYPFFYLGYIIEPNKIGENLSKPILKIVSFASLAVLSAGVMSNVDSLYWLRPLLTGRNPYIKLEHFAELGCVLRFAYYIVVVLIIMAIISVSINKKIPLLTGIGERSLSVYALHLCLIDVLWGIFGVGEIICATFAGTNLYVVMISISFVIMWICSLPIFNKCLKYVITPKLKTEE